MKFFVSILLMMLLSFAACLYFSWWSIALVAFFVSVLIPQGPGLSFLTGFLSHLILWSGLAYWISYKNDHLFAHKISMLILKMDNPLILVLITGLIGGLVAGLAAVAGSFFRKMIRRKVVVS